MSSKRAASEVHDQIQRQVSKRIRSGRNRSRHQTGHAESGTEQAQQHQTGHEQPKVTQAQGYDLRALNNEALSVALGQHPSYTQNIYNNHISSTSLNPMNTISSTQNIKSTLALPLPLTLPQRPQQTPTMNPSAFGSTYHHSGSDQAYPTRATKLCGMRLGNTPLEHIGIQVPAGTAPGAATELKGKWNTEIERQKANPPALPRSQVNQLPPKVHVGDPVPFPHNGSEQEKQQAQEWNDWLSSETQRVDRERNNRAAKKSRETRLEALQRTRRMLNEAAAERDWLRLKLIQLGGDPTDWDDMDENLKGRIVEIIESRVKASDQQLEQERKQEDARRRAARTRQRQGGQRFVTTASVEVQSASQVTQPAQEDSQGAVEAQAFHFDPTAGSQADDNSYLGDMSFLGSP